MPQHSLGYDDNTMIYAANKKLTQLPGVEEAEFPIHKVIKEVSLKR